MIEYLEFCLRVGNNGQPDLMWLLMWFHGLHGIFFNFKWNTFNLVSFDGIFPQMEHPNGALRNADVAGFKRCGEIDESDP